MGSVLRGVCLAAALLLPVAVRAEDVPSPRIDVRMPDIRASIMSRLQNAPRLPLRREEPARPAGAHPPGAASAPAKSGAVHRPTAPTPPKAPSMSERPVDTSVHRVEDPTRRDDHVPMPDKSVTVRTLDDLDRLETQYFQRKKANAPE